LICRNHPEVSEGVRPCSRCGASFCSDCLVRIGDREYCAMCKNEQLLDVRSGVDRSHLAYSSFWKRLGAYLIDYVLLTVVNWAIMLPVMFMTGFNAAMGGTGEPSPWFFLIYIPMVLIPIFYEALMLQKKNGQTLGKLALQIRVVRPDGSPITNGQAWGRSVMRLVLGCLIIFDYVPYFFTDEKTTLHDMVATTRVVDIV
jgi:uncharacterized RDD family membrane protein YckC